MSRARREASEPTGPTAEMFEAHVAFELARWTGDGWAASLREEVEAALAWLDDVRLGDVVDPQDAATAVRRTVLAAPVTDAFVEALADALVAAHARAAADPTTLAEVLDRDDYDAVVDVVAGMSGVRSALIEEVTTSEVYSQLIAHVLYTGIKDYLLTQNVVARRVPGASSLLRLGHSAVGAAAPGLERGIDRQLTSFVAANVADSIRDSRDYLEASLDDRLVRDLADELWARGSQRTVADAAALLDADRLPAAVDAFVTVAERLRASESVLAAVAAAVADAVERHADRPVGTLLADLGVTADAVVAEVSPLLAPWFAAAFEGGHVEARIRARLRPFYASWSAREA